MSNIKYWLIAFEATMWRHVSKQTYILLKISKYKSSDQVMNLTVAHFCKQRWKWDTLNLKTTIVFLCVANKFLIYDLEKAGNAPDSRLAIKQILVVKLSLPNYEILRHMNRKIINLKTLIKHCPLGIQLN